MTFFPTIVPSVVTAGDVTAGFHKATLPIGADNRVFAVEVTPKNRDGYGEIQYALKRSSGYPAGIGQIAFLEYNGGHTWKLDLPFSGEKALLYIIIWPPIVAGDIIHSVVYLEDKK